MSNPSRLVKYDLAAIALVAFATHGLLLLMDGVYFDGHLLYTHLTTANWPVLHKWFNEAGLMFFEDFYRGVGALPNFVFAYRLFAFLSLTLTAMLWYLVGYQSRMLSRGESLCMALIQLTFPAFRTVFSLIVLPYVVCQMLFVLGVYVALRAQDAHSGRRIALRLTALMLLFFSFSTNSFLVFYLGFIVFMVFYVRAGNAISLFAAARTYMLRHVDFLLLPFAYWFVKETFWPRHGLYEGYNRMGLHVQTLVINFMRALTNSVPIQLNDALVQLFAVPALSLLVVVTVVLVYMRIEERAALTFASRTSPRAFILSGAALVVLAIVPYALVSKPASAIGWDTRFSLLVPLGVSVATVGVLKALFGVGGGRLSRAGVTVLTGLILAYATTMVDSYLSWQQRWIKDYSVVVNLRAMTPFPASTFWIDDQFPLPDEVARQRYWDYDWSTIFKRAWGDETRTGIYPGTDFAAFASSRGEEYRSGWGKICNASAYDPAGPQATLSIRPGPSAGGIGMVLWYWRYRYMNHRKFEAYLRSVTEVTVALLPEPQTPSQEPEPTDAQSDK